MNNSPRFYHRSDLKFDPYLIIQNYCFLLFIPKKIRSICENNKNVATGNLFYFLLCRFNCKFFDHLDMALFVDVKSQERVSCAFAHNVDLFIIFTTFFETDTAS